MLRLLFSGLGILLALASYLKLTEFLSSTDDSSFGLGSTLVVSGSIVVELGLAAFNIFRKPSVWTWRFNVALFAIFASYLIVRVYQGVPGCGCMGKLPVTSVNMLAFDLAVLVTLLLVGKEPTPESASFRLCFAMPILSILAVSAFAPTFLSRLNAKLVVPVVVSQVDDQKVIEIDPINGFEHAFDVLLTNTSNKALMIAGCASDWCVVDARLPDGMTTLHPGESKKINVSLCRLPTVNDLERSAMVEDAVRGKAVTKVPDRISIDFNVLPSDKTFKVGTTVKARPAPSYTAICHQEFPLAEGNEKEDRR